MKIMMRENWDIKGISKTCRLKLISDGVRAHLFYQLPYQNKAIYPSLKCH